MVMIINQESIQNKILQSMENASTMRPPSNKNHDSPLSGKSKLNPKKVTMSLRNPDTSSIVEIPLDHDFDEI